MEHNSQRGFRILPHTADLIVSAWAPTREECLAQAIIGLVASCAELRGLTSRQTITFRIDPAEDTEQLVRALDEVIYQLDVWHVLPQEVTVTRAAGGGLTVAEQVVPASRARAVGPVPKAITRHLLSFAPDGLGWTCSCTVDV